MRPIQTYTRKASARRAALADLGKGAVEGTDFNIYGRENGRYAYQRLSGATQGRSSFGDAVYTRWANGPVGQRPAR